MDLALPFRNHEYRAPLSYISCWSQPDNLAQGCPFGMHPNQDGHRAIQQAIWEQIRGRLMGGEQRGVGAARAARPSDFVAG